MNRAASTLASIAALIRRNGVPNFVQFGDNAGALPDKMDEATVTLPRVEIFQAGDYDNQGKGAYSEDFVAEMAEAYDATKHEAPVVLDHCDEGPAYGWINKAWVEKGGRLFAKLTDVPQSFAEAIKKRRYAKLSVKFYPKWKEKGLPPIRHVAFLGAQVPGVKGMESVKLSEHFAEAFGENPGDAVEITVSTGDVSATAEFAERIPEDPAPNGHGALSITERCGTSVGHWHEAYVDDEGNGFTSFGHCYGSGDCYRDQVTDAAGAGHVHVVKNGVVEAAGDPVHTHALTIYRTQRIENGVAVTAMSETPGAEELAAGTTGGGGAAETETSTETKQETPAMTVDEKQFAEEKARADKAEADLKRANLRLDKLEQERLDTRFEAAFSEGAKAGRLDPAEKPGLRATYDVLCRAEKDVQFSEGEKEPSVSFLEGFAARPKSGLTDEIITQPKTGTDGGTGEGTADARRYDRLHDETVKFCEEKNVPYTVALVEVEKRRLGK